MTPHQGSGAGQAIEVRSSRLIALPRPSIYSFTKDAYMIGTLLGHPGTTRESVAHALRVFDQVRRPLATKVWEKSRLNGQYFTFNMNTVDFSNLKGEQLWGKLQILGQTFAKNWEWSWTTSIDSSVREALHLLEA